VISFEAGFHWGEVETFFLLIVVNWSISTTMLIDFTMFDDVHDVDGDESFV
jgi:hypothetical protein